MKAGAIALGAVLLVATGTWALAAEEAPAEEESDDLLPAELIPGGFSGTIGFTNEYLFRGISQTDGAMAVQGSIDYSHDSGFYFGVWGSNVKFLDASAEIDYYGGLTNSIDNFTYNIGVIYYAYPGASDTLDYDYIEYQGSLGYDFGVATAKAGLNYSPDNFAGTDEGFYVYGDVGVPVYKSLTLVGHVGHQSIDDEAKFGAPDYVEYFVGVSAVVLGFNVGLRYHDTDISQAECFGGTHLCEGTFIVAVSRTM